MCENKAEILQAKESINDLNRKSNIMTGNTVKSSNQQNGDGLDIGLGLTVSYTVLSDNQKTLTEQPDNLKRRKLQDEFIEIYAQFSFEHKHTTVLHLPTRLLHSNLVLLNNYRFTNLRCHSHLMQ